MNLFDCWLLLSTFFFFFAGEFQIGDNIKPLDPKTVASFVRYGTSRTNLNHEATGHSLVYDQLYPFEGLQNYTSGIIHHVRLTGSVLKRLLNYSLLISHHSSCC